MELVAVLRLLWRRRIVVVVIAVFALLVGLSMAYHISFPPKLESRHYDVGVGSASALVDTPHSQVVDLGGDTGSDIATLSARASLLASLMASSPIKDEIAARAGLRTDELQTSAPDAATGASGATTKDDQNAHVLRAAIANVDSGQIPIISVRTQAPDAAAAAALANASISVLQQQISSVAGSDNVPLRRRVVVRQLGPARSATVSRGPSPTVGFVFGALIFLVGCVAIVGLSALINGWRRAAELESLADDEKPYLVDPPLVGVDEHAAPVASSSQGRAL